MGRPREQSYEFGPFKLDPAEHLLLRDSEAVSITPKSFDLLVALVENRGHLVTKEELMERVWPDSFVEEANLSVKMSELRRALGEAPSANRYIETVPRRGYRFVAEVTKLNGETLGHLAVDQEPEQSEQTDQIASDNAWPPSGESFPNYLQGCRILGYPQPVRAFRSAPIVIGQTSSGF